MHRRSFRRTWGGAGLAPEPLIMDNFFSTSMLKTEYLALNKRTRGPDLPYYCLTWTKFVTLVVRKFIKIVPTRCHILKLK